MVEKNLEASMIKGRLNSALSKNGMDCLYIHKTLKAMMCIYNT